MVDIGKPRDWTEALRIVEAEDPDRALSLTFAPAEKRGPLAAIYAFNAETLRIRDQIKQPLPGEIRLQWWRDLIASGADGGSGHPVGDALLGAIADHDLPRPVFDRFLEARIFDLYDDPMPTRENFEAYAGETASSLIILAAMVLSRDDADGLADAAGHAGVAQAASSILHALPQHRARSQVYVPVDLLAAVGCTPEEFLASEASAARAATAMAAFGADHDRQWRARLASVPKAVRSAFLPASLAEAYFERTNALGADVVRDRVTLSPLRKSWRYWRFMRG